MPPRRIPRRTSSHRLRAAASMLVIAASGASARAQSGALIINEWNCVGSQKWIGNPDSPACEGPGGEDCADNDDVFFGRVLGNGGDWIELVVTVDHLDIRGWQLRWAETLNTETDGTDIWLGNGGLEQGIITFTDDPAWSDLRAGTIITITERTTAQGGLDTDLTFDPCRGDWWVNVNSFDAQYITTVTNVAGDGPGNFEVGNDDWQGRILDADLNTISGPVGEGVSGWSGGGINSREVGRLEADPSALVTIALYDDGDSSSFGHPNRWSQTVSVFPLIQCPRVQDFAALRTWSDCGCSPVVLNEYNAVANSAWLNGGNAGADQDGGAAADTYFGRVPGNGGNWFELIVTGDGVDMRGWRLDWEETGEDKHGYLVLSADAFWSAVPAGTILTFIENGTADGGLDSDVSFTLPGGNWANIQTGDTQFVAATYHSQDNVQGRLSTGHDAWRLTIRDAAGAVVFGPAGEGAVGYGGRGVNRFEVCSLQENPDGGLTPASRYSDSIRSTFGALNAWIVCGNPSTTASQSLAGLVACPFEPALLGDLNGDGAVDFSDLLTLLADWGPCRRPCGADLDADGTVGFGDLLLLLGAWSA